MAVPIVDKKLLRDLEAMGFPLAQSTNALHQSGNSSLEDAIKWIIKHETDLKIDEMPLGHRQHGSYVTRNKSVDLDLWAPIFQEKLATGQHSISPALAKSKTNRSTGKELVDDQLEGSGDNDDINAPTNITTSVSEPAWSRSPPKTNSSKKRKLSEIDKAYKLLKRIEMNSPEDQVIEAVSNLEEVKIRGEMFIAKCIKYLVKEGLDKLFPKLRSDVQKWSWLENVD